MRKKILFCIVLTVALLSGCGTAQNSTEETSYEESTLQSQQSAESITISESSKASQVNSQISNQVQSSLQELSPEEEYKDAKIPGVGRKNFPTLDGSTANYPLLLRIYSELCGVSLDDAESYVFTWGTDQSWRKIISGESDLIIAYEPPEDTKQHVNSSSVKLEETAIGRDGLVFLVNKNNPVNSLTRQQLVDIYAGKITNWSEVGGKDEPIAAFQRNEDSGSQTLFLKLLMQDTAPMRPPTEMVSQSMGGLIEAVALYDGSGGSIGFSVYYYADLMYSNPEVKLLSVDGVAPKNESIASGEYPLVNDFYLAIRADEPTDSPARKVRDWIVSSQGSGLMKEENYIPLH